MTGAFTSWVRRAIGRARAGSDTTAPAAFQQWTTHTVHHPRATVCGSCRGAMFVGRGLHPFRLPLAGQERIRGTTLCDDCARLASPADFELLQQYRRAAS